MRISLRDRRLTSTQLKRDEWSETSQVSSSSRTVRRRLDDAGLYGRVSRKTDRHKLIRLNWAKEHKNWSVHDWNKVIWSDESKFNLFGSDGRVYIIGADFHPDCIQQTVEFGGGNVMMWVCVSCGCVSHVREWTLLCELRGD